MPDETIDGWLDKQIEYAENWYGMERSYKVDTTASKTRLDALREVRQKINDLWGSTAS